MSLSETVIEITYITTKAIKFRVLGVSREHVTVEVLPNIGFVFPKDETLRRYYTYQCEIHAKQLVAKLTGIPEKNLLLGDWGVGPSLWIGTSIPEGFNEEEIKKKLGWLKE